MAQAKYNEGRAATATGDLPLDTATLVVVALDGSYSFDVDHTASDLIGVLDTTTLTNVTVTSDGWLQSDPALFESFSALDTIRQVILREDSGPLIAYYDTITGDQPLEIEGDGTDVEILPSPEGWIRV